MVDVFISYSRENAPLVRQLAEAVKREGYSLWWDDELPPHLSYGDVITEKIGSAKAAIVVWSESAAASEWVRAEADVARGQKKLIQTSIDDRMPPMPFNQIQFASIGDWHGEDDHPGWRKVKASLEALCGPATAAPAFPTTPPPAAPKPPPAAPAIPGKSNAILVPLLSALVLLVLIAAGFFVWRASRDGEPVVENGTGNAIVSTDPAQRSVRTDARFTQAAVIDDPDGYTNVRSGASDRGFIVGRVDRGEVFTTFPQAGDWWQVRLADGRTGYMARSRIRVIEPNGPAPAAAGATGPSVAAADAPGGQGEILPDSDTRLLTEEDLEDLSKPELFLARNEIFARRGRIFRSPALRRHFEQFPWYRPQAGEVRVSAIEHANVQLIWEEERER